MTEARWLHLLLVTEKTTHYSVQHDTDLKKENITAVIVYPSKQFSDFKVQRGVSNNRLKPA